MTVDNIIRVGKVLKEFNIGLGTLVDYLKSKKIEIEASPGTKITPETYELIRKEFGKEQIIKEQSKKIAIKVKDITDKADHHDLDDSEDELPVKEVFIKTTVSEHPSPKIIGKIDIDKLYKPAPHPEVPNIVHKPEPESIKVVEPIIEPIITQVVEAETKPEVVPAPEIKEEVKIPEVPQVSPTPVTEPLEVKREIPQHESRERAQERERREIRERQEQNGRIEAKLRREQKESREEREREEIKQRNEAKVKVEAKRVADAKQLAEAKEQERIAKEQPIIAPIEHIETKVERLVGPKISGTMDLSQFDKKKPETKPTSKESHKGKRERIRKPHKEKVDVSKETKDNQFRGAAADKNRPPLNKKKDTKPVIGKEKFKPVRNEVDEDAVQKQIKETYLRMVEGKGKTRGSKYRKDKREHASQKLQEEHEKEQISSNILKMTEFVTVNDLAMMMDVPVIKVIEACMNLGLMVSINQRLDAEAMVLVAEEFGFKVEFVTADLQGSIQEEADTEEELVTRPPIVTVMGHVDHGKTSLLDYIRKANVIAGEAGGITQHIGAYNVQIASGERITFLDTPGHEAFTAMRARGAKVTDIAIIIIAADDAVMPQTREAINHAQAAGVPMIFAINKMDKPGANSERIREQLANMNLLVEDWGGKYQCQEISAKQGINVDKLLEKILLESELLDLKANPNKRAKGTVIESSLDKGRGYITTMLVQTGTLHIGDIILSGSYTGKIKAMFNERGQKITEAAPASPVSILGLNGAPAAGELFNVMEDEKEARDIANKREQLLRIQGLKTQKHITLEEIGRRIAIGNFQELNVIVKGDVDGSIEALSDSLIKLSTEEVHVNVIHKAVGAISESDVLLAAASNAIIIGFQVRPSVSSRKLAEKEEIEIRLYSVIYDAINEVKDGMEGMLAPEQKEEITATAEVREVFRISKVGSIAGCMVKEGKLIRNAKVRIIRDGIVVYTGGLGSLKRFKDDVKEVAAGYDCGLNIDGYNDIKTGDIIESYTIVEIKRKL
ncbi:MAG: translation initiation factor IF-2 [Bacteroidetes bacterium GWF2_41_61]|nr:MAG: translation initiation factor IF-2 [Bacteroidetes bacterium GWF2_41_61]OFY91840.1 MAG: translation initiation factor IF-2 [Bacteroidetes bacterium RIFOXYA12_FULL_40_10]HBG24737.1 translation initiation factor IF-2 [Rikenellaceae bacterium]